MDQLNKLTKELITIPSVTGDLTACNKILEFIKTQLAEFNVKEFEKNDVKSLLFYNTDTLPKKFRVILNAHVDVVPAKAEQFRPNEQNGKIYGRGAQDMKSGAAAVILAFKALSKTVKYPLALQIVTDEEVGGFNGAGYQLEQGIKTDFILAGESTDLKINNYAKGIVWAHITTRGTSAHGAYAWNGSNAIDKLMTILNDLRKVYPEPTKEIWKTTLNIATVSTTNTAQNKVPADATATLDFRIIPEDRKTFLNDFKKLLDERAELEIMADGPCQITPNDHPDLLALVNSMRHVTGTSTTYLKTHGGSDVRFYTDSGSAAACMGPVGEGLHTDNEWVDIKSIHDFFLILNKFLTSVS